MILDILVRSFSVAMALLVVYQIFVSRGGSERHMKMGRWTMLVSAALLASVMLRGYLQPAEGPLYSIHLLTGVPCFFALFLTGFLGKMAVTRPHAVALHRHMSKLAMVLLVLSLTAGIWSRLSH